MSPNEFDQLSDFVESYWGQSKRWEPSRRPSLAVEFRFMDLADAIRAVRDLFDQGLPNAPSPSEVKKQTRNVIRLRQERGEFKGTVIACGKPKDHRWAIFTEITEDDAALDGLAGEPGERWGYCVKCHSFRKFRAGGLLTKAELDDIQGSGVRGDEDIAVK